MRFGIHSNPNRDIGYKVASELGNILDSRGATPVFRENLSDTVLCIYSCGDMCHIYQALPRRYKNDASVNASCTCNGCSAVYKYIERNSSNRDKDRDNPAVFHVFGNSYTHCDKQVWTA